MRKPNPLDPLLSKVVQDILAATLFDSQRSWYLSDLAGYLRRRPSALQNPLAALVESGILERREDGNRVYSRPDPECPFLPELRGLILKTVGLVDVLRELLSSFQDRINFAFVHGSMARRE
jgi:DNA-binding transcriptional ArsR family regulator